MGWLLSDYPTCVPLTSLDILGNLIFLEVTSSKIFASSEISFALMLAYLLWLAPGSPLHFDQ